MEARHVYLRVMGRLLGDTASADEHRHSWLTRRLAANVLDSLLSYPLGLARLVADAASMSHPRMDPDKIGQTIKMRAYDAMANIDYFTGGMTGSEAVTEERMKAVADYKDMRRRLIKG